MHVPLHSARSTPTANPWARGACNTTNHRYNLYRDVSADWSQNFGDTCCDWCGKITFLKRVTQHDCGGHDHPTFRPKRTRILLSRWLFTERQLLWVLLTHHNKQELNGPNPTSQIQTFHFISMGDTPSQQDDAPHSNRNKRSYFDRACRIPAQRNQTRLRKQKRMSR